MFLTVCTATYNRAHTLGRVFDSLKRQDFKDFEWLVIDDGSTDNTREIVESFAKEAFFPIRYYYKENGGLHTALNYSYELINSKYVINIDSDDELTDNALTLIKKAWDSIPPEDYERFWLVSGRCIDSETNEMVGMSYPDGINTLKGRKQYKLLMKFPGEKSCCRKVDVLRKYPFPVYDDTKYVIKGTIWIKINKEYDQFCVNDVFRVYHTNSPDSLAAGKIHSETRMKAHYNYALFLINDCFDEFFYSRRVIYSIYRLSRSAILTNTPLKAALRMVNKWYKRVFIALVYPFAKLYTRLRY